MDILVERSPKFEPAHLIALWKLVEPVEVEVADLIWTQFDLDQACLGDILAGVHTYSLEDPWSDIYLHVVRCDGRLYLKDGHHRTALLLFYGVKRTLARVLEVSI